MKEFLQSHFNMLVALLIFLLCFAGTGWSYYKGQHDFALFAADQAKTFGGALLMGLTGKALNTLANGNGNGLPTGGK